MSTSLNIIIGAVASLGSDGAAMLFFLFSSITALFFVYLFVFSLFSTSFRRKSKRHFIVFCNFSTLLLFLAALCALEAKTAAVVALLYALGSYILYFALAVEGKIKTSLSRAEKIDLELAAEREADRCIASLAPKPLSRGIPDVKPLAAVRYEKENDDLSYAKEILSKLSTMTLSDDDKRELSSASDIIEAYDAEDGDFGERIRLNSALSALLKIMCKYDVA